MEDVSDGGYDRVNASVSFTLGAYIESLTLIGRVGLNGFGNEIGNEIQGNDEANTIGGLGGDDALYGFGGGDTLEGGAGADSLDGGSGVDFLYGGAGSDYYHLDTSDSAVETLTAASGGGTDTIALHYETSWTLGQHFENLNLYNGDTDGTGNSLNNLLSGTYGLNTLKGLDGSDTLYGYGDSDSLYGGAGADTLYGGSGNDFYYVDATTDRAVENDDYDYYGYGGADTVYATASFALSDYVETLVLTGSAAINATGNAWDNLISGNTAANTLRGLGGADTFRSGQGADVVIGGAGNDVFEYLAVVGSTPASRDRLKAGDGAVAFEKAGGTLGDVFDLSEIDANTTLAGVQDFVFGTATGKGRLWAANSGSNTMIRGNTDNDATLEFEVAIEDGKVLASAYTAADFLV